MPLVCSDYEVITVDDTPIGFTSTKLVPTTGRFANQMASEVLLTLETDAIRFTIDPTGTAVSALVGAPLASGSSMTLQGSLAAFSAHKVTNAAALHVHYFHEG